MHSCLLSNPIFEECKEKIRNFAGNVEHKQLLKYIWEKVSIIAAIRRKNVNGENFILTHSRNLVIDAHTLIIPVLFDHLISIQKLFGYF